MSLDKKISRRTFLQAALAAGANILNPVDTLAQSGASTKEVYREKLSPLVSNPEWEVSGNDKSEAAIVFNSYVEIFKKYYASERGASYLRSGLDRLLANDGEHLKMVVAAARKHGVPKEIVFLALAESHWSPFGENAAKAAGYWQFIPDTARMYGLQNVPTGSARDKDRYTKQDLEARGDERLDPVKSTEAAMRYMTFLKRFFDRVAANHALTITSNDAWTFAMWAYNRGPGHVRKTFLEAKGVPLLYPKKLLDQPIASQNNGTKVTAARKESVGYVPKIIAIRAQIIRFLSEVPDTPRSTTPLPTPREAPQIEQPEIPREINENVVIIAYRVQGGDNLTKIATWISPDPDFIELRKDQIRDYNERLLKRKLPDQINKNETLHIPAQRVMISPGETLDRLARTYCAGWAPNVAINHLRYLNGLQPGMQLQANKEFIVPLQNN